MPNWYFIKIQKQFSGGKTVYLTNGAEQLEVHRPKQRPNKQKQKNVDVILTPYTKVNVKRKTDLTVKQKTTQFLEKIEENF